ncbi:MAG: response regulator [Candidatus Omnitrophica bacterium]|nr:response regulator [Candidatus Omnitrophota bacterium]
MAKVNTDGIVLLVDDEESIREALGDLLEACGYTTYKADCYKSAVKELSAHPDIETVICDLKMPGESGLEVLKHINEKGYNIPLIFLTGFGTLESCQEAVKEGAFDYILKPIDNKDRIIYPLNHAIEKKRLEAKTAELQREIISMAEEHQAILDELLVDAEMKDKVQAKISKVLDKWDTKRK